MILIQSDKDVGGFVGRREDPADILDPQVTV